ncbi:MAG: class I SAM-dependent methyltransferase [Acidimicrobiales bacterium]
MLDLGCGHGFWSRHMAERGMQVVGIDPEGDRVEHAHSDEHHAHTHGPLVAGEVGAPVMTGDGARLPLRDGSVAVVWCIHVLHHLDDPVRVLGEIRRVLRPGGHLVLAETVEDNPAIRVARRIHPEWDGVAVRSRFTAATLLGLLGDAGFDVSDRRQHSLISFAAWALPRVGRRAWLFMSGLEDRLPAAWTARWGAHLECVARRD